MKKTELMEKLAEVQDPEMNISIVELGLVYDVKVIKSKAIVTMTLTSLGCPLFPVIEFSVKQKLKEIKGISDVQIILTFDPPWSFDKMSKEARIVLGV